MVADRDVCPVCLDKFRIENPPALTIKLQCEHTFCESCLVPWLRRTATCPGKFYFVLFVIFCLIFYLCFALTSCLPLPYILSTSLVCRKDLPTDDPMYEEYKRQKKRAVERETDIAELHNSMFGWWSSPSVSALAKKFLEILVIAIVIIFYRIYLSHRLASFIGSRLVVVRSRVKSWGTLIASRHELNSYW